MNIQHENHMINDRISILEKQMVSVVESITNINRRLSPNNILKRILYYIIVIIIYFVNKELESNVNILKSGRYWVFNILLCMTLILLRRPIMWFISKI